MPYGVEGSAKERGKGWRRGQRGRGRGNETEMPIASERAIRRRREGRVYAGGGRVSTVMEELEGSGEGGDV
jgi:hypothetical protein